MEKKEFNNKIYAFFSFRRDILLLWEKRIWIVLSIIFSAALMEGNKALA
jgi:hypothetical protein